LYYELRHDLLDLLTNAAVLLQVWGNNLKLRVMITLNIHCTVTCFYQYSHRIGKTKKGDETIW